MRICIIGGGKVGFYLAKTLLEHKHQPVVIDPDFETGTKLANELDIPVIHGDGTSIDALRAAEAEKCHAVVCASGLDEVNLVAAQLCKKVFNVQRTVARVNNPRNTVVFKQLGVDIVVSSTDTLVSLIEREVETSAVRHLITLHAGTASLVEVHIPASFRYKGETLADIPVPSGSVVVTILRGDDFIIPGGSTQILEGDKLMVAATDEALHKLIYGWKIDDKPLRDKRQ